MTRLPPRHVRRPVLGAVATAVVTAVLAWAVGVDAGHVAALGLAAAAVGGALAAVPPPAAAPWPPEEPPTSGAGWHQVALLAGDLTRTDRDPERVGPTCSRLRSLAASRLDRHGVAWTDPRARRLLGAELYEVLDGRRDAPAGTRLVALTLNALDDLEVHGADAQT